MKKLLLLIAAVATLSVATAQGDGKQHREFRSYGIYGTVDGTFMMNIAPQHDACELTDFKGYNDAYMLVGLTASAGWQWRNASAVGMGFSFLYDLDGSFSQIPLFLEFRSHLTHTRFSPYTAVQAGYSVPLKSSNAALDYKKITKGGMTFGLEVGGRIAFTRHFGMHLGVGYQMINCEVERGDIVDGRPATRLPELYHNLKANIGFNF